MSARMGSYFWLQDLSSFQRPTHSGVDAKPAVGVDTATVSSRSTEKTTAADAVAA
eukprot:CAMPEP_0171117318 /NCGR_PEP_ID=MMETSP0766_2-20121228/92205_1 /TAXON_ID=439317 /ORGANISM="Gambierdiscus australes, Strain CAWD 149" /LENGTH=54 /DNA_ID=CAMNT_0011579817 /DNA_START=55 /DNA_END=217 /DNA_ORIENTATION=+